jgi:hypothetical protein
MTNTRFVTLLRDYTALAKARGESYAEAVNTLVTLRHNSIAASVQDEAEAARQMNAVSEMAEREYGAVDKSFEVVTGA